MSAIVVREIIRSDFTAVTTLLAELGRPAPSPGKLEALRRVFWDHVDRSDTNSLLALLDEVPVGFLSLEFRDRLNWQTREAWIPDFIVAEAARGKGAGHQLFERARQAAVSRNCHRMVLESGHQRTVAHKFYADHGMSHDGRYYVLELLP